MENRFSKSPVFLFRTPVGSFCMMLFSPFVKPCGLGFSILILMIFGALIKLGYGWGSGEIGNGAENGEKNGF